MDSTKVIYYNVKDILSLINDDYNVILGHSRYVEHVSYLASDCPMNEMKLSINTKDVFQKLTAVDNEKPILIDVSGFFSRKSLFDSLKIEPILFYNLMEMLVNNNINIAIDVEFIVDFQSEFREILFGIEFEEYIPTNYRNNFYDEDFNEKYLEFETEYVGMSNLKKKVKEIIEIKKMKKNKIISLMFLGSPGTGKTFFGQELSKCFWGTRPIKINLGNYSVEGSLNNLIGSPKGYIGSDKKGELVQKIMSQKTKIIIFDEFDKSDKSISNFLHQLLEEGVFTDNMGVEHNISDYLIIFTSNNIGTASKDIPVSLQSRMDLIYKFSSYNGNELSKIAEKYIASEYQDMPNIIEKINLAYVQCEDVRRMKKKIDRTILRLSKES